jgi:hypothetical protein
MKTLRHFSRLAVLLVLATFGCDGDQPPSDLSLRPAEAPSLDAEAERLRRMQMITVVVAGETQQLEPEAFGSEVRSACLDEVRCGAGRCFEAFTSVVRMCEVKTFLALTRPQGVSVELPGGNVKVPDQGEPAKQTFAELGLKNLETAVRSNFIPMLDTLSNRNAGTLCGHDETICGVPLSQYASSGLAEAYDLYKQLVDAYVKASVNSADAELSSTSDTALAVTRAMRQRLAAARKLGGEIEELPESDFPGGAFCTRPSAPPAVRAAIAVIRDAAVDPKDLLDATISTLNLIEGVGGAVPGGSVRQRLAQFYFGAVDPASNPPATLPNGKTVGAQYGLELETFQEARSYLREEFLAFGRSETAKLPRRKRPDGGNAIYPSYSGTATAPTRLPAAYYGAWVRGNDVVYPNGNGPPGRFNAMFTTFATAAQAVIGSSQADQTLEDAALGPLALMVGGQELEAFVLARNEYGPTGVTGKAVFVYSTGGGRLTADDGIKLAFNADDLRCAVQGSIEGGSNTENQPCSLANLGGFTDSALSDVDNLYSNVAASAFSTSVSHAYLLKPRNGPAPSPQTILAPGAYEAVAGINVTGGTAGFPVVRGNEERIAALIEPSREWCAHPRVECSGGTFDERIALENELTDDGNGFEDSWRHYLALAKAAAEEADELGSAYINQSLQGTLNAAQEERNREQQLESARRELSRLQQLCGFTTDTQSLLRQLSDEEGNVMPLTLETCDVSASATQKCPSGYACVPSGAGQPGVCRFELGTWLQTHSDDPDIRRISDCINQSDRIPFVSLGDVPLCLWSKGNQVCEGGTRDQCPVALKSDRLEALNLSDPTTTDSSVRDAIRAACESQLTNINPPGTTVQATAPLGYFELPDDNNESSGDTTTDYISVRERTGFNGLPEVAVSRNLLAPATLYPAIVGLDWESRFDDYAAITYFGKELYTTGSADRGPNPLGKWPCHPDDRPMLLLETPEQPISFNCADKTRRMLANEVMFKAFVAAKLLGRPSDFEIERDDEGRWLLPVGIMKHDQLIREKHTAEWHEWYQEDFEVLHWACGDFKSETPSCGGAQLIRRQDNSPVLKTSCLSGTAYSSEGLGTFQFADLGCFHKSRLHVASDRVTRGALAGLSSLFPATGKKGDQEDWLAKFFTGRRVQSSQAVAVLEWWSDSAIIPGGTGGSHEHKLEIQGMDLAMGLGLVMRAAQQQAEFESPFVTLSHPPEVTSVEDLQAVSVYVGHVARSIRKSLGTLAFANVPLKVVDALRSESAVGAYPQFGGDMATHISNARGGLLSLHDNGPLLANEVAQIGGDIRSLKNLLRQANVDADIRELELSSQIANQLTACANGVSGAISTLGLGALGAAATCANSIAQIGFAQGISQLAGEKAELQGQLQVGEFGSTFSAHSTAMQTLTTQALQGAERFDQALSSIESAANAARSTLISAMQQGSFQAQHSAAATNVFANLSTAQQVRYQQALEGAKRLAFVAKRAIEQRLGVRLADQKTSYPLVEAPALWEGKLCSMSGINYADLTRSDEDSVTSYAEGFIGDYVRNLEKFVESYTLENNFHEGTDTAVVSLRDDIMNTRAFCPVPSSNLLINAGQLDSVAGWQQENCPLATGSSTMPQPDCVVLKQFTTALPFKDVHAARGASGYELTFGSPSTSTSRIMQAVALEAGLYRFTWFTKDGIAGSGSPGTWLGGAASGSVLEDTALTTIADDIVDATNGWKRRYIVFRVSSPITVKVGFQKVGSTTITLAGPMLERLEDSMTASTALIPFVNTTNVREEMLPACHDSDGRTFRQTRWQRGCMNLCEDGFSDHCTSSNGKDYCYWQTEFGFSQRDIQKGKVFNFSGFARGNFNYRIESVGLNFVGTALHDCSEAEAPETCYAAGYLPYSLSHVGPFFVRNYRGDDVETKLFDGNIEHARGLASERYLTSPLSSTDSALVSQFARSELIGRPLDGNFVLRIWDQTGVDFNAVEDVQIVLNYRYWTKFD